MNAAFVSEGTCDSIFHLIILSLLQKFQGLATCVIQMSFYFIRHKLHNQSDYYVNSNICVFLVETAIELKGSRDGRPTIGILASQSDTGAFCIPGSRDQHVHDRGKTSLGQHCVDFRSMLHAFGLNWGNVSSASSFCCLIIKHETSELSFLLFDQHRIC